MKKLLLSILSFVYLIACTKSGIEIPVNSVNTTDSVIAPINFLEYQITGTSSSVTIITQSSTGKIDTLENHLLPYTLKYVTFQGQNSVVQIINNKASGTITISLFVKGVLKKVFSVIEPKATAILKYNTQTGEIITSSSHPDEWKCNLYNNHVLFTGPRGGCYYINSKGNKTYVDRSFCNCD